jgi:PAS domain S-box-containing protein
MHMTGEQDHGLVDLRKRAEEKAASQDALVLEARSPEESQQLIHELRVHQIELEMQNEHLRQAQESLDAARTRYFQLYELAPVGYLTLNAAGLILEANLKAASLLGVARNELIQAHLFRFVLKDDRNTYHLLNQRLREAGEPQSCEVRLNRKDSDPFWVRLETNLASSESGAVVSRVTLSDITERKQSEEALRKGEEQLRAANEQLEQKVQERTSELNIQARQLRALAGRLTMTEQRERRRFAQILHDHLQQILASVKMQAGGLEEMTYEDVKKTSEQIGALLNEALRVSRSLTADLSPPILHEAGLKAGLQWLSRSMFDKHGLKVEMITEADPKGLADDVRVFLFEAVRELLFNAVKHSESASAKVGLRVSGKELHVTVRDYGVGFEPAIPSGQKTSTAGFGLFSIRERIGLFGGRFEIESHSGGGTQVVMTVPLDLAQIEPSAQPAALLAEEALAQTGAQDGKIRLLIADDHTVLREGLVRLLRQEPDIEVLAQAEDGRKALELAGKIRPDVILMDISMPHLDGIEATRIIRERYPHICVIGLSMFDEEDRANAMLKAGASCYFAKTRPISEVKAAIRECKARAAYA